MNIQKKRSPLKPIIALLIVAILCIGGYLAWAYVNKDSLNSKNDASGQSSTNDDTNGSNDDGTNVPNEPTADDESSSSNSSKTDDGTDEDTPSDGSLTITSAQYVDNVVKIRTLISDVTQSGSCTLKMTGPGNTITKTSSVQALPSGATCTGFDVPRAELTTGTWSVTVTYLSGTDTTEVVVK